MKKYLVFCIVLITVSSCMTTREINYFQTPAEDIPNYADTVGYQEYRLQRGDYLSIRLYSVRQEDVELYNDNSNNQYENASDNSYTRLYLYFVEEDGYIDYPYIGKIPALGKTTREIKYDLENRFKEVAKYCSVDVRLANRIVSIIGESGSKRINMPTEKITIFQALAMSGDLSEFSDRTQIKIVRQTENGTVVKIFDVRTKTVINSEFYYLQPNDVVYVQHNFAKYLGINRFTSVLSATLSTVSFGMMLYNIGNRVKTGVGKKEKPLDD
ncbi:MAG: polysaccharide biosynthesis/export family protein [Prevotellaceae bacterium]|jgi:polysaccharide export outer membrane protein|nr:polysaccharide biosynthesis/export family protein [Prevotellaceae bacterium]